MDSRKVDLLISLGSRAAFGVVLGVALATAGWFAAWFFFLRSNAGLTEAMIVFSASTGFFGGVGAGLAWLKLDDGIRANIPVVLLALLGGGGGAVAGLAYAHFVFDVRITRGEGDITAIAASGIAANIPPLIWFIVAALRKPPSSEEPLSLPGRHRVPRSR